MELIQYFILFRRWFWLIFLAAFVAGGLAFVRSTDATLVYRAETQILIGGFIEDANPDSNSIWTGQALANTYAELIKTNDVLQATSDALDVKIPTEVLRDVISTYIKEGTSLMVITVVYMDPVLAADIANEVAQQLVLSSPTNLTVGQQAQIDIANEQIATLSNDLNRLRMSLDQVDQQTLATEDSEELALLSEQRTVLVNQINMATATIAQFGNTTALLERRSNSLDIVETATISTFPVGGSNNSVILGALVGAALAAGVVLLIEYLNDKIRLSSDVAELLAVPVLGIVSRFRGSDKDYKNQVITTGLIFSNTVEEYRSLRVNLLFSVSNDKGKRYLITSPSPRDGKSVTAANLAVSMAMDNKRVLLVDADMRRPTTHLFFGLNNEMGLSSLLSTTPNGHNPQMSGNDAWKPYVQETGIPNLWVISSGFTPKNPMELLGSVALNHWMSAIEQSLKIDVILFDTAPCLAVSDSVSLAATANTQVVMVLRAGVTRHKDALQAKERFAHIGQEITGVVLNNANRRDESYYGYYGYGYSDYHREVGE